MKKRKLITRIIAARLCTKIKIGVPLAKAQREEHLNNISSTALSRLLKHYYKDSPVINGSLFPAWLDEDGDSVQEQPDGCRYVGYFPLGVWVYAND